MYLYNIGVVASFVLTRDVHDARVALSLNTNIVFQTLSKSGAEKESCKMIVLDEEEATDNSVSDLNSNESINLPEKVNINRVNLETKIPTTLETPKSRDDVSDEDDTFCLMKKSSLFSRISKNEVIEVDQTPTVNVDEECQMVAVKEREVLPSVLCGLGSSDRHFVTVEHDIEYNPLPVEVVELIETDLDADTEYANDEDEGEYEIESSSPELCENRRNKLESEMYAKNPRSVLLEMRDRVNRTEETTVTACGLSNAYNIDGKSSSGKSLNEVKLKKEIEMLRTYQIVGNYEKSEPNMAEIDECGSFYDSDKEMDDVLTFSDDEGINKKDGEDSSSSTDDDLYNSGSVSMGSSFVVEVGSF